MTDTFYLCAVTACVTIIIMTLRIINIFSRFRTSGTTSPVTAKTLEALGIHTRLIINRLLRREVLVEIPPDRYYLDETKIRKFWNQRLIRHILVAVLFIAVLLIIDFLLKWYV